MVIKLADLEEVGVSFLLPSDDEDKLGLSEINSSFDKLSQAVNVFIEMRADILMERGEKVQQYKHDQLLKLKNEEDYYVNKCQALRKNISDCLQQLNEAESSYVDVQKKIAAEEDLNKNLKEEVACLQSEKDEFWRRFQKTNSLYQTVIQWYENYLNICISINKANSQIVTFYFGSNKKSTTPFITFQVSEDFTFEIIETHPDVEDDKENFQKVYSAREVILFIYNTHLRLKHSEIH